MSVKVKFSFNPQAQSGLVDAVRDVLKASPEPLSCAEIVAKLEEANLASYDLENAVRVAVNRMAKGGEVIRHQVSGDHR